jgi:hypothetical protein
VLIAAQVVVSSILLWWILSRSNLGEILRAASGAHIGLPLAAYVLNFLRILISAVRWVLEPFSAYRGRRAALVPGGADG